MVLDQDTWTMFPSRHPSPSGYFGYNPQSQYVPEYGQFPIPSEQQAPGGWYHQPQPRPGNFEEWTGYGVPQGTTQGSYGYQRGMANIPLDFNNYQATSASPHVNTTTAGIASYDALNVLTSSTAQTTQTTTDVSRQQRPPFEWMKKQTYPSAPSSGKTRTKDKYRVVYTDHQRLELEKEFHYSKYITIRRKSELAQSLALSERQVKIWFQNRRAKERKHNKKKQLERMGINPSINPSIPTDSFFPAPKVEPEIDSSQHVATETSQS